MDYNNYLIQLKKIQSIFLEYIEDDEMNSSDILASSIIEFKSDYVLKNREIFKSFLYLISNISKNHYRNLNFFDKIFQILDYFVDEIKQTFSSTSIFKIFKKNKKILLFFIEKQIITIDQNIVDLMIKDETTFFKYRFYFYFEIKSFINEQTKKSIESELIKEDQNILENFEEKRQLGENDSYICKIIRKDLIDEFIIFINQTNLSIHSTKIKKSVFETNLFLNKKAPTLIEYAAFFGSIQIFRYLLLNNVELNKTLWLYAIHGKNAEIIHLLEENEVQPSDESYLMCLKEAIKCHHNDIANYIQDNLVNNKINGFDNNPILYSFHFHNFEFFPDEINDNFIIFYACKYDYLEIVRFILEDKNFDINITTDTYDKILFNTC